MLKQVTESRAEQDFSPKVMLFCPNCSHQSSYDGDWNVVKTSQGSRSLCPDCRTEITSRPTLEKSRSPSNHNVLWQMWGSNVRLLQKIFWV